MRLSHLTALAVMIALVGAMFVVPSVRGSHGKPHVGDVNSNTGVCLLTEDDNVYGLFYDAGDNVNGSDGGTAITNADQRVQVFVADSLFDDPGTPDTVENEGNQPDFIDLETDQCEAQPDGDDVNTDPDAPSALGVTFKITPDGTESPIVEPQSQTLTLTLGDTDGIIEAGGADLTGSITTRNMIHNTAAGGGVREAWVRYVRVSGEIDHPNTAVSTTAVGADGQGVTIVVPEGTTEGEYTVSVLAYVPDGDTTKGIDTISSGVVAFVQVLSIV